MHYFICYVYYYDKWKENFPNKTKNKTKKKQKFSLKIYMLKALTGFLNNLDCNKIITFVIGKFDLNLDSNISALKFLICLTASMGLF